MTDKITEQDNIEIIIKPNRSWFYIDWMGLLHYSDLLILLVKRDFISKYKQTILGPLWFLIQPLATTLVFTVIFGKVAKITTDGVPPVLFYLCGLLIWSYFATCVNGTSTSFVSNAHLFGKVYFPRLIVPLSIVLSNIFAFLIQLANFLLFYFYFKYFTEVGGSIHASPIVLLVPLFLAQASLLALGIGLWLSALTAKYRDLTFLMGFLIQLWMYATPVIYPMSVIPEKWRFLAVLNPVTTIVESYKHAFFATGIIKSGYFLVSITTTLIILFTGILVFNKIERTFIDTV